MQDLVVQPFHQSEHDAAEVPHQQAGAHPNLRGLAFSVQPEYTTCLNSCQLVIGNWKGLLCTRLTTCCEGAFWSLSGIFCPICSTIPFCGCRYSTHTKSLQALTQMQEKKITNLPHSAPADMIHMTHMQALSGSASEEPRELLYQRR